MILYQMTVSLIFAVSDTQNQKFSVQPQKCELHGGMRMNRGFSINYLSESVILKDGKRIKMSRRRLANVGSLSSTFSLEVMEPEGVKVLAKPRRLT